METSLDAYNSEGQFKVTCGHLRTRSYSLSLLTWWMESLWMLTILKVYQCCRDLKLGGQNHLPMLKMLKVSSRSHGGHQRSNCLQVLYVHETWWMESSLHANNSEGQVRSPGVTQGQIWLTIVVWT